MASQPWQQPQQTVSRCSSCLLPCAKLRQLALGNCCLQLHRSSQVCADLQAVGLTSLSLAEVTFTTMPDLIAVLAGLPNLQQLGLRRLYLSNLSRSIQHNIQHSRPLQLPSMLLPEQKPQITPLQLEGGLSAELLQQVALATQLQHLSLQEIRSRDVAEALVGLQQLQAAHFPAARSDDMQLNTQHTARHQQP